MNKLLNFGAIVIFVFGIYSCKSVNNKPYVSKTLSSVNKKGNNVNWQMINRGEIRESLAKVSQKGYNTGTWKPAIVPGTVLNSMVTNGDALEPYYGLNNKYTLEKIPDIKKAGRDYYNYIFRTEFDVSEIGKGQEVWLKFHGINYIAEIWLNGKKLGTMKGMFKTHTYNVTDIIKKTGNVLAIDVQPDEHPGGPKTRVFKKRIGEEPLNGGDGKIGRDVTMLMSVGWDFTFRDGIRDRNIGIWRPIELYTTGKVDIRNSFVKTDLNVPKNSISKQTVIFEINNPSEKVFDGKAEIVIPQANISIEKEITVTNGNTVVKFTPEEFEELVFNNPKLWWPINKGAQFLYDLNITIKDKKGNVQDTESMKFGIRKITSDQNTPDKSRIFYVNGKRIFIRGSNWIPEGMLRTSEKRMKAELLYTRQAGINLLRLWGGGITESDQFFQLCDSLGIMVWTEFWLTGDTDIPQDAELYKENVRSTIKRIRKHPSLAYYVSSNERDSIIPLKSILDELDGTRGYQLQSECCGVHDGSPYKYENPMQYYDNTASRRGSRIDGFCPEYGAPCMPPVECLREMMDEKDIFPPNPAVWKYLNGKDFYRMVDGYLPAVDEYGKPTSAADLALKGQLVGAMSYRSIWENWNYNKLDAGDRFASGVLFWYHNCPIREVDARMWDWSLEPTAALYATQRALNPLHLQYHYIKNTITLVNDYAKDYKDLTGDVKVFDLNSKLLWSKEFKTDVRAEQVINDIFKVKLNNNGVSFVFTSLKNAAGKIIDSDCYWVSNNKYEGPWTTSGPAYAGFEPLMSMPETQLTMTVNKTSFPVIEVSLQNQTNKISFFNRIKIFDSKGNLVRPVFYSDNYYSLLPKSEKSISIDLSLTNITSDECRVVLEGVNIKNKKNYE